MRARKRKRRVTNIDMRTLIEALCALVTPVFAAGGAWVSIKFLREEVRELKIDVRRVDGRVVNLYQRMRVPVPEADER